MDTGLNFLQFSYKKIDPAPELAPDPCTFLHIDLIAGYGSALKRILNTHQNRGRSKMVFQNLASPSS
jgi:hypothetical protein